MSDDDQAADAASARPHGAARPAELVRHDVAPHLDPKILERKLALFRTALLRADGPHHLAHYNRGVYEFALDLLTDPRLTAPAGRPADSRRAIYRVAGRQLSFMMTGLDRLLQEAQTGRLIRTVLHTERGAMFCCSVVPEEQVIGIVFDRADPQPTTALSRLPLVKDADMVVSDLAESLRETIGLPRYNTGGWLTRTPDEAVAVTEPPLAPVPTESVAERGAGEGELRDRCQGALNPHDLVYIAHYLGGKVAFNLDIFDTPEVMGTWGHISAQVRREFYARLSPQFESLTRQLSQLARPAISGHLVRFVLDVEQGAIYYYRLNATEYLVGVTINQSRVSAVDDQMADLALHYAVAKSDH